MDSKEQNNSSDGHDGSDLSGLDPRSGGAQPGGSDVGAPNIYDLVPVGDQPTGQVANKDDAEALPKGRKIASGGGEASGVDKRGKVGDSGLLDDFDEDADFSVDPQVEQALFGNVRGAKHGRGALGSEEGAIKGPAYVKEGFGTAEQLGWAAGGVFLAAVITTCVTADSRGRVWFADGIMTAYSTLLHTVTGVLAVFIGSYVAQRPLGNLVLAAARMGLAVCVLQFLFHLNIPPSGRFDETFLAVAGYCGVIWGLFRFKREEMMVVVCSHASMWMALWLSGVLYAWSAATIVKPTP